MRASAIRTFAGAKVRFFPDSCKLFFIYFHFYRKKKDVIESTSKCKKRCAYFDTPSKESFERSFTSIRKWIVRWLWVKQKWYRNITRIALASSCIHHSDIMTLTLSLFWKKKNAIIRQFGIRKAVRYVATMLHQNPYWRNDWNPRRGCKYFIPKKRVHIFFHSTKTEALVLIKESYKTCGFFFPFFKMTHFTTRNGPFCRPEWIILTSRTGRFRLQNESFWKPEKCKENTSRFFSVPYNSLIIRAYASTWLLFWKTCRIFV